MAISRLALALGVALLASCTSALAMNSDLAERLRSLATVDGGKIASPPASDWLSNGRDYREQRFSPLSQINTRTVAKLGVAWEFRTFSTRALEASPIVANGVMYITAPWSKVFALDAATGRQIWTYDPHVPGAWARYACCDVPNRGVAIWKGAVFVGTLDGRLVKLDAATGKPVWDINTIDRSKAYTITGTPRIVKGLDLI